MSMKTKCRVWHLTLLWNPIYQAKLGTTPTWYMVASDESRDFFLDTAPATAAKYRDKRFVMWWKNICRNQYVSLFIHLETMTMDLDRRVLAAWCMITADGSINKTQLSIRIGTSIEGFSWWPDKLWSCGGFMMAFNRLTFEAILLGDLP